MAEPEAPESVVEVAEEARAVPAVPMSGPTSRVNPGKVRTVVLVARAVARVEPEAGAEEELEESAVRLVPAANPVVLRSGFTRGTPLLPSPDRR